MHTKISRTATGAAENNTLPPLTHAGSGCVVSIFADPDAPARYRYGFGCTLDGKSIGESPKRFSSAGAAFHGAADFIAHCYNAFGHVVIGTVPALRLVPGAKAAEAA